jgi:hypothetical protein
MCWKNAFLPEYKPHLRIAQPSRSRSMASNRVARLIQPVICQHYR